MFFFFKSSESDHGLIENKNVLDVFTIFFYLYVILGMFFLWFCINIMQLVLHVNYSWR